MAEYVPVYPKKNDPLFSEKIAMMEDFGIFKIPSTKKHMKESNFQEKAESLCKFEKTYYQHFVTQYISRRSPYKSLLLYHGLGSGKTCSAITIAEAFLKNHRLHDEPVIWVVSKKALVKSFEQEIFRTLLLTSPEFLREQCTGDSYYQMIPDHASLSEEKLINRIYKIIRSRYVFFGYDKFANTIEEYANDGTLVEKVSNKVIIVDEAHNIRNLETSNKQQKNMVEPFIKFITECRNNRLVFLTATPMFNEPEEILWLMSLLQLNEKEDALLTVPVLEPFKIPSFYNTKNEPIKKTFKLIKDLSSRYISYVRGNNPFTFAVRVRPKQLNVRVLETAPRLLLNGEEVPDKDWLKVIKDGIVPSVLSGIQLESIEYIKKTNEPTQISKLRQLNNITYVKQFTKETDAFVEGKIGIDSIFKSKESGDSLQYEYINPSQRILDPASNLLVSHATKFYTISKLLQQAKGIIVIYSNFIWAGCVPLAIMLEHMGVKRYGEKDILSMRDKVKKAGTFVGTQTPYYCVLSGNKELMGTSKIDSILNTINADSNKNGEVIKIVLMSPIASEGLTFKNVREMHILEPWFHMNTTEQAIGRTIRHCSHSGLPINQRNVTVYLHACIVPDNSYETEDLHAYRVSAKKQYQIDVVDKVIRENAIDCTLMKNVNYFPKEIFDFATILETSHGTYIEYLHGDDDSDEVACANTSVVPKDRRAFRKESYQSFIPTLQIRLLKYLQKKVLTEGINTFQYEELIKEIHENAELAHETIQQSLYPYKLWGDYGLTYHNSMFIVTQFKKEVLRPTKVRIETIVEVIEEPYELENILVDFVQKNKGDITAIISYMYEIIDSKSWKIFAERCVTNQDLIDKRLKVVLDILDNEGSFIRQEEIPSVPPSRNRFSGYLNIFAKDNNIEGFLYENGTFQELLESSIKKLQAMRKFVPFTDPKKITIVDTIGFVQPYNDKRYPDAPTRFQFKLGLNNTQSKRQGIVCNTSGLKKNIRIELQKLEGGPIDENTLVSHLCTKLWSLLHKNKRMWYPVAYKPSTRNKL